MQRKDFNYGSLTKMIDWTSEIEKDLQVFLKEWIKLHSKSQSCLKIELGADSSRMDGLIRCLKTKFKENGISTIAYTLCLIEEKWINEENDSISYKPKNNDPFSQLDFLLEELGEDISN